MYEYLNTFETSKAGRVKQGNLEQQIEGVSTVA